MAKSKAATFVGSGRFPYDMLRYDCCYPMRSEDVNAMDNGGSSRERKVCVVTSSVKGFTVERWRSFGWTLVDSSDR